MPSMSQIHSKKRDIVVLFEGDDDDNKVEVELHVTYRPMDYTPRQISELQKNRDINTISEMTKKLVVAWDLTMEVDGVEVPVPIETESLLDVPLPIQLAIMKAANADQTVDAEGKD